MPFGRRVQPHGQGRSVLAAPAALPPNLRAPALEIVTAGFARWPRCGKQALERFVGGAP